MRLKALLLAFLCVTAQSVAHSDSSTSRIGLTKIDVGSSGWGPKINTNYDTLDSSVACLSQTNAFTGTNSFSNQPVSLNNVALRFYDSSLGRYMAFQPPGTANNTTWTLPSTDGVAGQCLSTNGSGGLSFATVAGVGGGASVLAVTTGSSTGFSTVASSPTAIINFEQNQFGVALKGGATAYTTLNVSSVTLMGNTFNQASQLIQLNGSAQLPALDGSLLTGIKITGVLAGGATSYWNAPSTATFVDNFGISASTISVTTATISGLAAGECVQTGAGGLLQVSGEACDAANGANTNVQYNNNGILAGSSLEIINSSSITFQAVSTATYTGFSTMTMTQMYFDGSTSSMTFSSGTIKSQFNIAPNGLVSLQAPTYTGSNSTYTKIISSGPVYSPGSGVCWRDVLFKEGDGFDGSLTLGQFYHYQNDGGGTGSCPGYGTGPDGFGVLDRSGNNVVTFGTIASDFAGIHADSSLFWGPVKLASSTISSSQFVKTDSSNYLVTYDLLNATQTWTGSQVYQSSVAFISSGGTYETKFSSSSSPSTFFHVGISTSGHFITGGPAPTISSCGSGPSGSVVGDDNEGTITVGGGAVTACTLTFANTWGSATTPTCVITDNSTAITGDISSISATAFTASFSLSIGGGTIWYRCGCSGSNCR